MTNPSGSLRDTLRLWGSGVSIVTTAHTTPDGVTTRAGMTVSAFNSLSLEPPMILVCLNKEATAMHTLDQSNVFAVSILAENQAHLSDRFSGRVPVASHADRFEGVETYTVHTGSPIIQDALAWLDCRVHQRHDGNTHWIIVGEVLATGQHADIGAPLIYFNRNYHTLPVMR